MVTISSVLPSLSRRTEERESIIMVHGGRYEYDSSKKSGQIPRFGEWENANEMPITQYFENARQAGLLRHNTHTPSSPPSSSETLKTHSYYSHPRPPKQTAKAATKEKKGPQGRVRDISEHAAKQYTYVSGARENKNDVVIRPSSAPKPVDEDLYKIPPDLLYSSKRKKIPGLFSCLVPCAS